MYFCPIYFSQSKWRERLIRFQSEIGFYPLFKLLLGLLKTKDILKKARTKSISWLNDEIDKDISGSITHLNTGNWVEEPD